ncbi:MAG TPA: class I SAM-dependent methyltransferase [Candidatus Saccharimonadales bacterium]|nr:class I SAM-dependent methyltransferase [Candidatus Saccharimonadales bacterium]
MTILLLAGLFLVVIFSFVILFGAPFLPTLKIRTADALDLLDLKPGQTLLELGCGDGRILRAAAERGIHAIGYELNPLLVVWARLRTWRYRRLVRVRLANYWQVTWPPTDGIYVFLLNPFMKKLDKKLVQYPHKPVRLVSFAFEIPGKKPTASQSGMFRYDYR